MPALRCRNGPETTTPEDVRSRGRQNAASSQCAELCLYRRAVAAGLHPELEKPGLLIPLVPGENTRAHNRRRPADLYLPAWVGLFFAALGFAVTAPQRQGTLARAAETVWAAATDYSDWKREHQGTEDLCHAVGVTFVPMVAETTGAWAPEAMAVFRHIASATSAASGRHA